MAVRHANVPVSVGRFASIEGPPEWFPDRIPRIFVLLMSQNVQKKKSHVPKLVPKRPKMSQTLLECPKTGKGTVLRYCVCDLICRD